MRNLSVVLLSAAVLFISTVSVAAPVQELGDSQALGLNEPKKAKKSKKPGSKPDEKISDLGDGVYVRQYKDFGQPMVEVHPETGPSYYYNENEIQKPNADDGVLDRQTPNWMLQEW